MENKPPVKLTGRDGNAFSILAACQKAARKANMPNWDEIRKEMMAGDYDHLLCTACKYFDVD
jgi:hypothetical protein